LSHSQDKTFYADLFSLEEMLQVAVSVLKMA